MDLHPLVVATWRDAFSDHDLHEIADVREDYLVVTAGFLLGEGPTFITIAAEILPDGDGYRAVTHVPVESLVGELERPSRASGPIPADGV